MALTEAFVASVVADISKKMAEPRFGELAIGAFTAAHPDAARWLAAQTKALGGSDRVVNAVFHASVVAECFTRHQHRDLRAVGFGQLDRASAGDSAARLKAAEPAVADYLEANVDHAPSKKALAVIALALSKA